MDLALKTVEKASAGAALHLKDPYTKLPITDGGKPVILRLAGSDSKQWRACERALTNSRIDAATKAKTYSPARAEQQAEEALDLLAAVTLGWENCSYEGETAFSKELVRRMYDEEPWVAEQVNAFITDRANFAGASKPT